MLFDVNDFLQRGETQFNFDDWNVLAGPAFIGLAYTHTDTWGQRSITYRGMPVGAHGVWRLVLEFVSRYSSSVGLPRTNL